jgi:hypothetical protein
MTKPTFPYDFSFPFDYCMPMVYNGGGGGDNFNEIGPNNGIVSSLTIYMAAHRVAGSRRIIRRAPGREP